MSPKASNVEPGYDDDAYPLTALLRTQPSMAGLQALVAVARLGSLNKAAGQLCRTQGAVSRQIQQLERHYQTALFLRSASGMQLTADGVRLLDVADKVLSLLAAHARPAAAESIRLRLPSTLALRWFLPRQHALQQLLPGVTLAISTSASDEPLFAGDDVDAMIVRGSGIWPGMYALPLFAEQLTPMCRPELATAMRSAHDLATQCLLHAGVGGQAWQAWLAMAGVVADAAPALQFDSLEGALSAAAMGYGVALGDPRMAQARLASGELVRPFAPLLDQGLAYYLVLPEQAQAQAKLRRLAGALQALA